MSHPTMPSKKHQQLVGKTIRKVRPMYNHEVSHWGVEAVVIEFADGSSFWLSSDSEGNNAGDIHNVVEES